ncbi:hypothetical protein CIL05_00755 [Virgibacillus profundi]|uniref:HTH araC/xylS-type domain-containing protein n=1 Tax=Virgibacillus profundi TaxID=2024555 RepID=A0A2A2IJ84_9BACI|nr:helix-turn-helix domain-containing protein [Virgibacillus profundi]PAV31220.1 hypothetical protein CIL05_00755 [Virgibacillus profundi]PXY55403.1 AraC family transcriptional regulator [Virgibacillus profundi]
MWRKRKKTSLLYKYIISYLLVFLVPFLIMSLVIYFNSVSNLRQEIEQSNINKLEQVENITNERMKELETIAARISYDPRLTPYMISHGYYGTEAINELTKYEANSSIVEELFVYYHEKDTIYSTNGSYSIDALLQNKYSFNDWDKQTLLRDLHTKTPFIKPIENVVINNEHHVNMIAYLFPVAPGSPNPYGTVMYFIEEDTIADLIKNISGELNGNVYILNESNEVITSVINDESIDKEQLAALSFNNYGVNTVELNGKDHSLVSVQSEMSGWKFITLMDTDEFFKRLDNTTILISAILIALLIIGFILAVLLGKNQYKPIQKLFEITKRDGDKATDSKGENELETIRKTITDVFEDQQILNNTMYLQRPFAREQFLIRLLKGDISDHEEIDSLIQSLNIQMWDDYYFVAIVYFEKGTFTEENIDDRENIFNLLSEISLGNAKVHGIDLFYNDSMALIISLDRTQEKPEQLRKEIVSQVQLYIRKKSLSNPTIGVGRLYDEKNRINRSYIEALATMEYKFINPEGSIIYIEELSSQSEQSLGYPEEDQMKLVQSLKQGDETVAAETLQSMFAALVEREPSIQVSKIICFDIINTIVKTVTEMGQGKHISDLNRIADFNSIEQLHQQLQTIVMDVCKEVDSKKESHNDKMRNDILDYIKASYKLYDLSLESVALKFQLSVSYLSRFFKEQTGTTFTQYVQDLRMNEVKRLLKETDQPIKDIVVEVGYKDVANFTRKFKNLVGVTPGQYRKLNK